MKNPFKQYHFMDWQEIVAAFVFFLVALGFVAFLLFGCSTKKRISTDTKTVNKTESIDTSTRSESTQAGTVAIDRSTASIDSNTTVMDLPKGGSVVIDADGAIIIETPAARVIRRQQRAQATQEAIRIDTTQTIKTDSVRSEYRTESIQEEKIDKDIKRRPSFMVLIIVLVVIGLIALAVRSLKNQYLP